MAQSELSALGSLEAKSRMNSSVKVSKSINVEASEITAAAKHLISKDRSVFAKALVNLNLGPRRKSHELFSLVLQPCLGSIQESEGPSDNAEEAFKWFQHHTTNVRANTGLTQRVIITDSDDYIIAEWKHGEGVVLAQGRHFS